MKLLILTLVAGALCAQTTTPVAPATITGLPSLFAAAGGGFAPVSSLKSASSTAEGWVSMAFQMGANSPYYSITTIDLTSANNAIRTGFARVMSQSGNLTLMARVDAGVSTAAPVISSFSAGAIFAYNIKKSGLYVIAEPRITANPAGPAGTVNLGFYLGIGKSF